MSTQQQICGKVYVLGDNIDTDQIIPARHLVYSLRDQQERLNYGKYALSGLPPDRYPRPFVEDGHQSPYSIIIAGRNFGSGSSREQAPACLQIAGIRAVVAQSYARIFYRNAINGAFLLPLEFKQQDLSADDAQVFVTGDEARIDLASGVLSNLTRTTTAASIQSIGQAMGVVESGGIFAYARQLALC